MSGWVREVDAYFSFAAGVALPSGVCHAFSQGLKELHMNPRIEIFTLLGAQAPAVLWGLKVRAAIKKHFAGVGLTLLLANSSS